MRAGCYRPPHGAPGARPRWLVPKHHAPSLHGVDTTGLVFAAIVLLIPVGGIWDALRHPPEAFAAAGRSRTWWVAVQVVLPILGSLVYYAFVRPRVRAEHRWGGE